MTHEELIMKLWEKRNSLCDHLDIHFALSAVVELHKPVELDDGKPKCMACETTDWYKVYPCPTIQAIEKALQ